jgi:hypothetical protein
VQGDAASPEQFRGSYFTSGAENHNVDASANLNDAGVSNNINDIGNEHASAGNIGNKRRSNHLHSTVTARPIHFTKVVLMDVSLDGFSPLSFATGLRCFLYMAYFATLWVNCCCIRWVWGAFFKLFLNQKQFFCAMEELQLKRVSDETEERIFRTTFQPWVDLLLYLSFPVIGR